MEQELAFTTLASISNNLLKAVYEKKSDVICFWFPPGFAITAYLSPLLSELQKTTIC